jgi:4-phytase/acid phosphatase
MFCRALHLAASLAVAFLMPSVAPARPARNADRLVVDRVILVMRHGIRAPLAGEVPDGTRTAAPWAPWPVAESRLTPHGIAALERVAAADRRRLVAARLLPPGCPAPGSVRIWTNVSDRTIASGQAYARGFAPGCALVVGHRAAGEVDPLFEPLRAGATRFDAAAAMRAIDAYTGGMARLVARHRVAIAALDGVLGCTPRGDGCVPAAPPRLVPTADGRGVDLTGPIRATSGVAQVLLLQYAEGLPIAPDHCCRIDAAMVERLGALHAALFDVFTRAPYMAAHQAGPLGAHLLATLSAPDGPAVELLMGHDTNVTALSAALRVPLKAPGYASGDVAPGGALEIERLHRVGTGRRFVRLWYRTQSPATLRIGGDAVSRLPLAIPGCAALCPADRFADLLRARLAPARP